MGDWSEARYAVVDVEGNGQQPARRPAVHQVVRGIVTAASPSVRNQAPEFVDQLGIPL
jgi:hypothetical protein